ncbi:MAG: glycerol-3-phosphate acyltransferase [Candidatus Paceibacterota bacterium]
MTNNDIFLFFLLMTNGYVLGLLPMEYIASKVNVDNRSYSMVIREIAICSLSFLKGFLAVFVASLFDAPLQIQALCGITAIIGHSWSPFFDFKENKGFPVLLGSLLPLYFPLVLIMLLVCIIFSILWTVPVAIMISVLLGITMTFTSISLWNIFLLLLFALFVFLIKRLLPLKDLFPLEKKKELLENRIFFDNDTVPSFRRSLKKTPEISKELESEVLMERENTAKKSKKKAPRGRKKVKESEEKNKSTRKIKKPTVKKLKDKKPTTKVLKKLPKTKSLKKTKNKK